MKKRFIRFKCCKYYALFVKNDDESVGQISDPCPECGRRFKVVNRNGEITVEGFGVGQLIRQERTKAKLKVYELAKMVQVTPVYITVIEKHDRLPSPGVMKKIAAALKAEWIWHTYAKEYLRQRVSELTRDRE